MNKKITILFYHIYETFYYTYFKRKKLPIRQPSAVPFDPTIVPHRHHEK